MANNKISPRKFSEKIALLNKKEAEGNAKFEEILKEVSQATKSSTNKLGPKISMAPNIENINQIETSIDQLQQQQQHRQQLEQEQEQWDPTEKEELEEVYQSLVNCMKRHDRSSRESSRDRKNVNNVLIQRDNIDNSEIDINRTTNIQYEPSTTAAAAAPGGGVVVVDDNSSNQLYNDENALATRATAINNLNHDDQTINLINSNMDTGQGTQMDCDSEQLQARELYYSRQQQTFGPTTSDLMNETNCGQVEVSSQSLKDTQNQAIQFPCYEKNIVDDQNIDQMLDQNSNNNNNNMSSFGQFNIVQTSGCRSRVTSFGSANTRYMYTSNQLRCQMNQYSDCNGSYQSSTSSTNVPPCEPSSRLSINSIQSTGCHWPIGTSSNLNLSQQYSYHLKPVKPTRQKSCSDPVLNTPTSFNYTTITTTNSSNYDLNNRISMAACCSKRQRQQSNCNEESLNGLVPGIKICAIEDSEVIRHQIGVSTGAAAAASSSSATTTHNNNSNNNNQMQQVNRRRDNNNNNNNSGDFVQQTSSIPNQASNETSIQHQNQRLQYNPISDSEPSINHLGDIRERQHIHNTNGNNNNDNNDQWSTSSTCYLSARESGSDIASNSNSHQNSLSTVASQQDISQLGPKWASSNGVCPDYSRGTYDQQQSSEYRSMIDYNNSSGSSNNNNNNNIVANIDRTPDHLKPFPCQSHHHHHHHQHHHPHPHQHQHQPQHQPQHQHHTYCPSAGSNRIGLDYNTNSPNIMRSHSHNNIDNLQLRHSQQSPLLVGASGSAAASNRMLISSQQLQQQLQDQSPFFAQCYSGQEQYGSTGMFNTEQQQQFCSGHQHGSVSPIDSSSNLTSSPHMSDHNSPGSSTMAEADLSCMHMANVLDSGASNQGNSNFVSIDSMSMSHPSNVMSIQQQTTSSNLRDDSKEATKYDQIQT